MDVRALSGGRPEGRSGPQILHGYVSLQKPAPTHFTDPLWVIVPSHAGDVPYGPLLWPVSHGATLPAQGSPVTLALALGPDGQPGVPVVMQWDAIYSAPAPGGAAGGALTGAYPNPTIEATVFTGLSYSAGYADWGTQVGVTDQAGQYGLDPLGFTTVRGVVLKSTTWAIGDVIATLPAGNRPGQQEHFVGQGKDSGGTIFTARIDVNNTGTIVLQNTVPTIASPGTLGNLSLSGIRFHQEN